MNHSLEVQTRGRGTYDITHEVAAAVRKSGVRDGLAMVFVHHTSASVIITENADPDVRRDLDTFAASFAPDSDPMFVHTAEGPDDMSAHVRSVFTQTSVSIPVREGRPDLGTWQGVFLWEHRTSPHRRRVTVSVLGAGS